MCLATKVHKSKIGNLLVRITSDIDIVYHTKLLNLLFKIDELATITYGSPITWLEYKVWSLGPIPEVIYNDIRFEHKVYNNYIRCIKEENGTRIIPIIEFDDSEFSIADLKIINHVITEFGNISSNELIDITHQEDGLWKNIVNKKGGEEILFDEINTTPYIIDFSEAIKDDQYAMNVYNSALESMDFYASL